MRALVINTYGGSLLLGARAAGAEIVGSYEDAGFGSEIQEANFPQVEQARVPEHWASRPGGRSLREVVIVAHPPCSAFSVQNANPDEKGIDSEAFACTKRVATYALGGQCAALAIESVTGALEGAREVHDDLASRYGYRLHRVLQNAILFGVPQWRERFWAVFVRKDLAPATMHWTLTPVTRSLGDVLGRGDDGPGPAECARDLAKLKRKLDDRGIGMSRYRPLFEDADEYRGGIDGVIRDRYFPDERPQDVHKRLIGGFRSRQLRYLGPGDYAPTLMSDSWWWYAGRQMALDDYSRVMGFPADYIWPGRTSEQQRLYLSKGVVPAVARWVLDNLEHNLNLGRPKDDSLMWLSEAMTGLQIGHARSQFTQHGEVALFRGQRSKWERFLATGEPPVRDE